MKPNISQKEFDTGEIIINQLFISNPRLLPYFLKQDLPDYESFSPEATKYGLWFSKNFLIQKESKIKYDKIVFLCNGLAASGKDSIYNEMINLNPNLFFKTVTATSRPMREGEIDEVDYFFYKPDEFLDSLEKDEFLEFIKRGETYYGLPKKSLDFAFNQPNPIIYCQIEMSGWNKLEEYINTIKDKKILIIKAFVLPDMSFTEYIDWLKFKRANDDLNSRISKTGWELKNAPQKADFIITNRIRENSPTLTYIAKTIINQLIETAKLSEFPKFITPTEKLTSTKKIKEVISIHDSIE